VPPAPFEAIAIVGLGLIGGSVALAVRNAWPSAVVMGVDADDVIDKARARGAVEVASSNLASVSDADLVVLAAPVQQNIGRLLELPRHVRRSTVVTDVGSTKRAIVDAANRIREEVTFVGGHPLAGATSGGIESASLDLFVGRRWLFTPEADASRDTRERLYAFVSAIGAQPHSMGAAEHDHLMAFISHLPQLAASVLMQVAGDEVGAPGLQFAGPGFLDTTRLADSPSGIWRDICLTNADYLQTALDRLVEALNGLRAHLTDRDAVDQVFAPARKWRERMRAAAEPRPDHSPEGEKA
jgi:prephenate dehydrogenase